MGISKQSLEAYVVFTDQKIIFKPDASGTFIEYDESAYTRMKVMKIYQHYNGMFIKLPSKLRAIIENDGCSGT